MSRAADRRAHGGRGVAIVGVGLELDIHVGRLALELDELVLGQSLRRKDVERSRRRVLGDRVEDRQVVAEGLARGGRRHDDGVVLRSCRLERGRLMRVELGDAPAPQGGRDPPVEPLGERRVPRRARRDPLPARDHFLELRVPREPVEDLFQAYPCGKPNGRSHRARTIWNACSDVKMTPGSSQVVRSFVGGQGRRRVRCARADPPAATSCRRLGHAAGAELPDLPE